MRNPRRAFIRESAQMPPTTRGDMRALSVGEAPSLQASARKPESLTRELVTDLTEDELLDLYHSALCFITDPSYLVETDNGRTPNRESR
jgi:hypothetical protein